MDQGADVIAGALTIAYSGVLNRLVPPRWHLPANLAAAGALVVFARSQGATWDDLGLSAADLASGVTIGAAIAAPVAAGIAVASMVPATRGLFADSRPAAGTTGTALYETLFRIPIGTALTEELIFRGVLLGLSGSRRPRATAIAWSSALFGLWHVLPSLEGVGTHALGPSVTARKGGTSAAVAGSVVVTAGAGVAFCWLRYRSRSVLASTIVHATLNAVAFAASRRVARLGALRC